MPITAIARILAYGTFFGLLLCVPARAYVVDATGDGSDANPGDAVCATAGGDCTLRAAVEQANASPGMEWVQLEAKTYRRSLGGELAITDDLGISYPGASTAMIDAAGLGRVLHVHPGVSVTLRNLVIRGGADNSVQGGAGILNEGNLTLEQVAVIENTGSTAAGIHNNATLHTTASAISYNGPGAALLNDGSLDMQRSEIAVNNGVGLENRKNASLAYAAISYNAGGGVLNYSLSIQPASVQIVNSVLLWNTRGGALRNSSMASLRRSTVSGNRGDAGYPSAILTSGTLGLEDVTITANGTPLSSVAALAGGGTIRVINTIIAGNTSSAGDPDCQTIVTSLGHNLMSCTLDAPDPTTSSGDPLLAPLKQVPVLWPAGVYPTYVHMPLPGSPAIDNGTCIGWPDQRGANRPQGGQCDIGASETTPLCTGGVGMADTQMRIRVSESNGMTIVKVRGQLLFSNPLDPEIAPLANGLQLRIENVSSPGEALLERTLRTEPVVGVDFGCGGWRGSGTRFRWKSSATGDRCNGGLGRLAVGLDDHRASDGVVDFKAVAKAQMPAVLGPIRVTVVLDGDPVGGDFASNLGDCAVHVFECTSNLTGTKYRCE